ncbi:MAG: small multi-drug export protein [Firmicutes bacterium]|nr:small multi-drug export protein [Bacillota bacterium]
MAEKLVHQLVSIFDGMRHIPFGREIIVFLISLLPILELRGGLIAASLLDLEPFKSFLICFIGNILPLPFIIWFITPIFNRLKKTKLLKGTVEKLENKALSKKEEVTKYEFWGLLLFVAIPLPGTGGWTGALVAAMINMDKKKALLATIFGVFIAGLIMMILSFGVLGTVIS